jgi:hypothetical protein
MGRGCPQDAAPGTPDRVNGLAGLGLDRSGAQEGAQ